MVSRAAQGLAKRRLVDRSPNEADGRSHRLALTDAGVQLHREIAPLALAYEANLLAGLDAGAISELKALLMRLERAAQALDAGA
jgi:DNA-binding MarR family transcriptional regulator